MAPRRAVRYAAAIALMVVGVSAAVAFEPWKRNLARFSPDGLIGEPIWLVLQVLLISLCAPGLLLLFWTIIRRGISRAQITLDSIGDRTFILSTLLVAAILRVGSLAVFPLPLTLDWGIYHQLAQLWAAGGSYTLGGTPTALFPPGWPFFLSRLYLVFGPHPLAGAIANLLLAIGTLYLSFRVVRHVFGDSPARWAAIALATLPSQVVFTNLLCSEHLFTFLLLLAITLALRQDQRTPTALAGSLLSGICLGLATLVRSVAMLYPVVLIPLFLGRRRRGRDIMLRWTPIFIGLLLVTAPWIARNYRDLGRATISTNGGLNFYIGNNPRSGVGFNDPGFTMIGGDSTADEAADDRLGYQLGMEYIRRHPVAFLRRGILKVAYLMADDVFESVIAGVAFGFDPGDPGATRWWAVAVQSCWYIFVTFAAYGMGIFLRHPQLRSPGGRLFALTIGYWFAVHFMFFGSGRFHFPIVPMLAGFAAFALTCAARRQRR